MSKSEYSVNPDVNEYIPTRLRFAKPTTDPRWAIGVDDGNNGIGMIAGPFTSEVDALEVTGGDCECIYLLTETDTQATWRWHTDRWLRVPVNKATATVVQPWEDAPAETAPATQLVSTAAAPTLSGDQQVAITKLRTWMQTRRPVFVLRGFAGTGKTFLMRLLNKEFGHNLVFTAPTNKAAKVLAASIGSQTKTTYSALGLRMEQVEEGLVLVASERPPYYPPGTVLVVDEASMVNAQLTERIVTLCESNGLRVIFVGDPAQLPPVGEVRSPVWAMKLDPSDKAVLKEIMRFDNQLLNTATALRKCLQNREWVSPIETDFAKGEGVKLYSTRNRWLRTWFEQIEKPEDTKLIKAVAWRNRTVNELNRAVRTHLGFHDKFNVGEFMLLAEPIEYEGSIIAHTDDEFRIDAVEPRVITVQGHDIRVDTLHATQIDNDWHRPLNVPVNQVVLDDLLGRLARRARGSSGSDRAQAWRNFWEVKREFMDVRYSPAMTAHRVQGSTYCNVFLDQGDILANRTTREAFQCLYVGATRPTTQLHVI